MARSTAPLHIVEPLAIAPTGARPIAPERRLRTLFRKEARLQADLIEVRREIGTTRANYARKHGLLIMPGVDRLRELFG